MKYLLTVAALLAATACADSTAPTALRPTSGAKDTDFNETEPSALATVNPCNNDAVELTGTLHLLIHTTEATSGNTEIYLDVTTNYAGTGAPSLLNYQGGTRTLKNLSIQGDAPFVLTLYQDIQLQSQTGADNFLESVAIHITVNANGVPTADVERQSERCNG